MHNSQKPINSLLAVILYLFTTHSIAQGTPELPGPLVDVDWLTENLEHVVVLDVRKNTDSFLKEGHIEGAFLVDTGKMRVKRKQDGYELKGMLPDRKTHENFMSAHGVGTDSTVIITSRGDTPGHIAGAARLYWQMKYYGFERVALLDGGNRAWTEALGDLTREQTTVDQTQFVSGKERDDILARMKDVEQALTDKDTQLVDTRSLRFHVGLEKRDYVADYGHIPGSRLFPHTFLYPEKGAAIFYPADVISQTLETMRIDPDKELILYCNSAYDCSSVWFAVHELLGKKNVRVYDGALNEWTMDSSHPMTREISR